VRILDPIIGIAITIEETVGVTARRALVRGVPVERDAGVTAVMPANFSSAVSAAASAEALAIPIRTWWTTSARALVVRTQCCRRIEKVGTYCRKTMDG
jgi:hypothetical protein